MALRLNLAQIQYRLRGARKNSFIEGAQGLLEVDPTPIGAGCYGTVRPFQQDDFCLVKSGRLVCREAWSGLLQEEYYINRCHGAGSAKIFYFKNNVELTGEALELAKREFDPEVSYRLVKVKILGETLERALNKHYYDAEKLLSFYIYSVQALMELHAKGVIHGDIKADNIIIRQDFTAAVIDFGCSYDLNAAAVTAAKAGLHWAPERNNITADKIVLASTNQDVFSFGYMLDWDDTILSGDSSFRNLIRDCLMPDPAERPSLQDILACLTAIRARYIAEKKTHEDHINTLIQQDKSTDTLEKYLQQRPLGTQKIDFQIALDQFEAERDALLEDDPYKLAYSKVATAFRNLKPSTADLPKLTEQLYRLRFHKAYPDHGTNLGRACKLTESFSPETKKVVMGTIGIFLGIGLLVVALGCALHTGGLSLGLAVPAVKFMMGAAVATKIAAASTAVGYGVAGAVSLKKGIFYYKNSGGDRTSAISPSKELLAVAPRVVVR